MARLFLRDCAAGDTVEDVFVISGKQLAATTSGKPYLKALISDRSMQLNARMWNTTRDIFLALPESGFIKIRGRIESYQSNLQLIIEALWPARDNSFALEDLVPHTSRDIVAMFSKVVELIESVQNRHLAALLSAYLEDEALMDAFRKAPAAVSMHHAFLGGLLEHTLNAMEVADAVVRFYPGLNRDLVLAGIFLHDLAKTWELNFSCAFGYSDGGNLVGHIVKAAVWVEDYARRAEALLGEQLPQPLIDVLQHIIISHHGLPEFGAAKTPGTPEALAVHIIEHMDAKLMMALCATRGEYCGEGSWTEYMKAFNGRLYRPDVAPADAPLTETPTEAGAELQQTSPAANRDASQDAPTLKLAITNPLFGDMNRR